MPFVKDRDQSRQMFFAVRRKAVAGQGMSPLEAQIAAVINEHPEYHGVLDAPDAGLDAEFLPEQGLSNPFLHMGLHLALREQTATNRPPGVREAFTRLTRRTGAPHAAEHIMMDCLAEALWSAQRAGLLPDETAYVEALMKLAPD